MYHKALLNDDDNINRLEQLKLLARVLAAKIDEEPGARDLASLARQYRETLREIAELEGDDTDDDEISRILQGRDADGEPGAVRKNRT